MDDWLVREDDRPYLRPPAQSSFIWPSVLALALIAIAAGSYYYYVSQHAKPAVSAPAAAPQAQPQAAAPQAVEPAIRHPLEADTKSAEPLPTLDNSDSMMRRSLAGLIGGKAFNEAVNPSQLVRRIVATVDNLPRPTAPRRMMPLNPVPGAFAASAAGDDAILDAGNAARYAPYIRILQALDTRALVYSYAQAYPLFQQAYEELGYSGKYFNDRLVEAIDDMLAAPEVDGPIKLLRPKVLYEFADPELESRSAGQKVMVRIGRDNEQRVKEKLLELRRELLAASERAR